MPILSNRTSFEFRWSKTIMNIMWRKIQQRLKAIERSQTAFIMARREWMEWMIKKIFTIFFCIISQSSITQLIFSWFTFHFHSFDFDKFHNENTFQASSALVLSLLRHGCSSSSIYLLLFFIYTLCWLHCVRVHSDLRLSNVSDKK